MVRTFSWDPWQELEAIRGEINRLVGRGGQGGDGNGSVRTERPPMSAREDGDTYVLTLDMPGVTTDGVDIEVAESTIRISAERGREGDATHVRYERTLTLPEHADTDRIEAEMRDGVLTLRIPRRQQATPKRIPVRDAHGNYAAGREGDTIEAHV
ncbi:MAG: hypothetical protein QOK40_3052 [Miltoncostaeaceae bacterium]|nr:hypothetical protein [Miltoncostaeaceae bacterium]